MAVSHTGATPEVLKVYQTSQIEPIESIYPWVPPYSQNVYKVLINMEWSSWVISPRSVWEWLSYWALTLWARVFSPEAFTVVPAPSQTSWGPALPAWWLQLWLLSCLLLLSAWLAAPAVVLGCLQWATTIAATGIGDAKVMGKTPATYPAKTSL